MKPPRGQHYERWFHKGGPRRGAAAALRDAAAAASTAMQTFHSALPVAFHNSTWIGDRTISFIKENRARRSASGLRSRDPHHPFDAPEPWSRLHHPTKSICRPSASSTERRPWWHRQSLEGKPQIVEHLRKIREQYSRPGAHRPASCAS